MNTIRRRNSQKERFQWLCVAIICGMTVWFFSCGNLAKEPVGINPIALLKMEQKNPIRYVFTKFVFKEVPDRLRELL